MARIAKSGPGRLLWSCDVAHRCANIPSVLSKQQMKRAFQFAAMLMVELLAVQPALAAATCATGGVARAACPMGMSEMGAECPMMQGVAAECTQDCCNHSVPKAMVLPAAPAKPNLLAAGAAVSPVFQVEPAAISQSSWQPAVAASSSPPLHLLNRVFRI
jgi:hypothetical protein